ncbi:MAG TPA: LPS assembly protein LptD [Xanthomonadaceae bacterium]|nr:LPS assembly protein LptD [Xanthomonadaceae bacterium]
MRLRAATCLLAVLWLAVPAPAESAPRCRAGKPCDPRVWALCRVDAMLPSYTPGLPLEGDREAHSTYLSARAIDISERDHYLLEGDVVVRRLDQILKTERLRFSQIEQTYTADLPLSYQDRNMLVEATRASGDLDSDSGRMEEVRYQFIQARGSGEAASVELIDGDNSVLSRVTYSTCDPEERRWEFRAQAIELDHEAGWGTGRNMSLRVADVPILYMPYWRFPLDERRQTGFLMPVIGSSSNTGVDLAIPYYLNLAPNYDATLSVRLIGGRGVMAGAQGRYLFPGQRGDLEANFLPDDNDFGAKRWFWRYRHDGRYADGWTFFTHLSRVSDPHYFEDFGDSLTRTATRLLFSRAVLGKQWTHYRFTIGADSWQVTDPLFPVGGEPYRRQPRLTLNGSQPLGAGFDFAVASELVAFRKDGADNGQRLDLYPHLVWKAERGYGFLRQELGLRYTGYHLDRDQVSSPSRTTPIAAFDAGLFFDRDTSLFGRNFVQTLEPRLFYLYVPFRDQDAIPLFDTLEPAFGFSQLFRTNRFVGADRQMDANQLSAAVSSRFIDDRGLERITATFGQIRYFQPQRVQLPGRPARDVSGSFIVGEVDLRFDKNWRVTLGQQWDPAAERSEFTSARLQYRFDHDADIGEQVVFGLSYRNRRDFLEQYDLSVLWPVRRNLRLLSRWNYSMRDRQTLEALAGFEYETCCTVWRGLVRRYIRNVQGDFNNGIWLELELKGLGNLGRKAGPLLERAILGYGSAFDD